MLQNHIHLSTTLNDDGIENAPSLTWVTFDRLEIPEIFMTIRRSLTGKLREWVATDDAGPIQLNHLNYTLKITNDFEFTMAERIAQVKAMMGRRVYLCDHYHAANGQDHTPDVKVMLCKKVGTFAPVGPGLPFFRVDIELEDASL